MHFDSLLIVTYGRTGSTLLMGVLNTIPGVLIRGENMNACAGLYQAYSALRISREQHGASPQDSTRPFHGADRLDLPGFLNDMRAALHRQLVPAALAAQVQCWGFKEIRYIPSTLTFEQQYDLPGYLDFLVQLMPSPGFIFLTRDHAEVSDSAFWKRSDPASAFEQMEKFEASARQWAKGRQDCFELDYRELTAGSDRLDALFDFIGARPASQHLKAVLTKEHSYDGKPGNLRHVVATTQQRLAFVTTIPSPRMLVTRVDRVDGIPGSTGPFGVGGIALARRPLASIHVTGSASTPSIRTGIDSPVVGSTHPEQPGSAVARFHIDNLMFSDKTQITVSCTHEDGTQETLFQLNPPALTNA